MNILNLPDYVVIGTPEEGREEYRVTAQVARSHADCPHCQAGEIVVDRWSRSTQTYRDLPLRGKRVMLVVRRQRYRCRQCGRTWMEALPAMAPGSRMTERLHQYVVQMAAWRPLAQIAAEVGVSEGTVRGIVKRAPVSMEILPTRSGHQP